LLTPSSLNASLDTSGFNAVPPMLQPLPAASTPALAALPPAPLPLQNPPALMSNASLPPQAPPSAPVQYVPFLVPVNLQAQQLQDLFAKQGLQTPSNPAALNPALVELPATSPATDKFSPSPASANPKTVMATIDSPLPSETDFTLPLPSTADQPALSPALANKTKSHWQDRLKQRLPHAKQSQTSIEASDALPTKDVALVIGEDGRIESPPARKGELFGSPDKAADEATEKTTEKGLAHLLPEDESQEPLAKQAGHLASQLTSKYLALRPDDEATVRKVLNKGDKLLNDPAVIENLHEQASGYYKELGIMRRPARWFANHFIKRLPEDTEFEDHLLDKQTVQKAFDWVSQPLGSSSTATDSTSDSSEAPKAKRWYWPFSKR
jgi:hypothetical protein